MPPLVIGHWSLVIGHWSLVLAHWSDFLLDRTPWLLPALWLVFAFALGAAVGSFINVCVARLPYEKSLLWPGSRCGSCFQPIRGRDNIPVLSYLLLRGRCRTCGARFSARYLAVELFTALAFAGLFYVLMFRNALDLPALKPGWEVRQGFFPPRTWPAFFHYATLLSFLIVVALCDLADMEIPLSVTVTGTLVGLALATLFPWPYPEGAVAPPAAPVRAPPLAPFGRTVAPPVEGLYAWPVWYPLPAWLPPGSPLLGLLTGLAGALAGAAVMRGIRFVFGLGRGIEGLGMGDADLMMMAGAFVGWQVVLFALVPSVFLALFMGIVQLVRRRGQTLPFAPPLAVGVMLTALTWPGIGPGVQMIFFEPVLVGVIGGGGALMLLMMSLLLRLGRGAPPAPAG
jgi:leader peptidase (prepilin peptidase) / N-methyltransferase